MFRALHDDVPRCCAGVAFWHKHLVDDVNDAVERLDVFVEDCGSIQHHRPLAIHRHRNGLAFHRGQQGAVLEVLREIHSRNNVVAQSRHHAFREIQKVKRIQIHQLLEPFNGRAVGKEQRVFIESFQADVGTGKNPALAEKRTSEVRLKGIRGRVRIHAFILPRSPKTQHDVTQRFRIHDDRPSHAQFRLHPNRRGERVDARHIEGDGAHAYAVDVAFGFLKEERDGVALGRAIHVVRAFRVHEGHRFSHRNGELIRRKKEICEVDRSICFALGPCRAHANGREQRDDFERVGFHCGSGLDEKRKGLFQGCLPWYKRQLFGLK